MVTTHCKRNLQCDKSGPRFDLADLGVSLREEKRLTVRKVVEHIHAPGALEQIGYFREHPFLFNRVE
jgi:hypothetical protein